MEFVDKMKQYLDTGVAASKDALSKAGSAVQDFGGKSVLKLEIQQLESRRKKTISQLGEAVYTLFRESNQESLAADDEQVAGFLSTIGRAQEEIEKRKIALQAATVAESSTGAGKNNSTKS